MRERHSEKHPEADFEFRDGYVAFRPSLHGSFHEAVAIISTSLAAATLQQVTRLLVDARGLTGFPSPKVWQRFWMVVEWANITRGLRLSVVARAELIDPERFGVVAARNRGLFANVFASESEAIEWLLDPEAK